jgi:hypothetical protein
VKRGEEIRALIRRLSLDELVRIDAGLEGAWSETVTTVWTRERGLLGFGGVPAGHSAHVPSLELMFPNYWVGVRCFVRDRDQNVFDETFARAVIDLVERRLG